MYIKDLLAVSPQPTYDQSFFENKTINHSGNQFKSIEPDYKSLIPAGLLRRMGKATRMGVGAGLPLLQRNSGVDGIIVGTANGGLDNCMRFLNQIEQYEEGSLTPTDFVQSTPNSVAGLLSVMTGNTGYNNTHVHKGLAFENALLDAKLLFERNEAASLLVGNVEEISEWNYNIEYLEGQFKEESVDSNSLLNSTSKGTVCGEGSAMFILEPAPVNAHSVIKDVDQLCFPAENDVIEKIKQLLDRNNLIPTDIRALVLGMNGDIRTDFWYQHICSKLFPQQGIFTFKNLTGEYPTASAFATWLSSYILQGAHIPSAAIYKATSSHIENILIYNQYKGAQHGFILMSNVKQANC